MGTATTFAQEYARLNDRQRMAVDTVDGPVMVIAGPGTGKTQLLSCRVANILRKTDASASNILCLTFTENGQRAMEQRLLAFIGPDAHKVSVHTFHGFGTAIITSNPEYFVTSSGFTPADNLTLYEVLHDIFVALPHKNPLSTMMNGEYLYHRDAAARISQLKQAGLTPDMLRSIIVADSAWCQPANTLITALYNSFTRVEKKHLPLFRTLLDNLAEINSNTPQNSAGVPWFQPIGKSCVAALQSAIENAEELGKTTPLSAWKATWLSKEQGDFVLKATNQHVKLRALADIYEHYLQGLQSRRVFDYDDMILMVLQQLETNTELLASLQEQFQYILVDEYQDTNGAQARLIEFLADNPVNEGRPNLMIVGDDDQAIFGFQGADASVMVRFRERWRDVITITLTDNYRSTQGILDVSRALITQGQNRLENIYSDIVKVLTARAAHAAEATVTVASYELASERDQYFWLRDTITRLRQDGQCDIAVIAPRHKYLQRFMPYLLDSNIPVMYERRSNVLDQRHVNELLTLAQVIHYLHTHKHMEANALLPELLSYEFWGIAPQTIWQLSLSVVRHETHEDLWLEAMQASTDPSLQQLAEWLLATAAKVTTFSLEELFDVLLGPAETGAQQPVSSNEPYTSPFRRFYFSPERLLHERVDYVQVLSSLVSIRQALRDYRSDERLGLGDFVQYVQLCRQAGIAITDTQTFYSGDDPVHLLTTHKSKGLEYDHVFILNADDTVWLKEKGMQNKLGLPPNLLIQPAGESEDDRLRALYVAATRARRSLTFSRYLTSDTGKTTVPLGWLSVETITTTLRNEAVVTQYDGHAALVQAITYDWHEQHYDALAQPELRTLLHERLDRYRLSPTHLSAFLDVTNGGPRNFLLRHILRFPEAMSPSAAYGSAIHSTIEHALTHTQNTGSTPSAHHLETFFASNIHSKRLHPTEELKLLERGRDSLTAWLALRGDTLLTPHAQAERNFAKENVHCGPARLSGKIDRLDINHTDHTVTITDFKTGGSLPTWNGPADYEKLKLHKYQQQLIFYKLLVEGSRSFSGYHATRGSIAFVEPHKLTGELYDLDYAYSDNDTKRLETLIQAVWERIMALDLPDTSGYPPNFKGVQAFEHDIITQFQKR